MLAWRGKVGGMVDRGRTEGCARSITCTDSCSPDVKSGPILM